MKTKSYLIISGLIFAVVSVGHILRVMNNWPIMIGSWNPSILLSWFILFIAAAMCVWAIHLLFHD